MDLGCYSGYTANADIRSWQHAQNNQYDSAPCSFYDVSSWKGAQSDPYDWGTDTLMIRSPTCPNVPIPWPARSEDVLDPGGTYGRQWRSAEGSGTSSQYWTAAEKPRTTPLSTQPPMPSSERMTSSWGNRTTDSGCLSTYWQPAAMGSTMATAFASDDRAALNGDGSGWSATSMGKPQTLQLREPEGINGPHMHASSADARLATSKPTASPPSHALHDPNSIDRRVAIVPDRRVTIVPAPKKAVELVTHALTVQGPQQGLAMVTGRKQIENRSWKIGIGWVALHVGSQPLAAIGEEWCERMRKAWPEAPPEKSLPSSKIVGLIHISDQRRVSECLPEDHPQAIWAVGPVCHIIDQAVRIPRPIPHRGSQGLWEIEASAREQLLQQIWEVHVQTFEQLPLGASCKHPARKVKIDQKFVGFVIGPGGQTLRRIEELCGGPRLRIQIDRTTRAQGYSTAELFGSIENCEKAALMIAEIIDNNGRLGYSTVASTTV